MICGAAGTAAPTLASGGARRAYNTPSLRARVSLGIVLALQSTYLVTRFLPVGSVSMDVYLHLISHWSMWMWYAIDLAALILAVVVAVTHATGARYALAGLLLVARLLVRPAVSVFCDNAPWYSAFRPPNYGLYADMSAFFYWRSLAFWVLGWVLVACAICLAIPERRGNKEGALGGATAQCALVGPHPTPAPRGGAAGAGATSGARAGQEFPAPSGTPVAVPTAAFPPPSGTPVAVADEEDRSAPHWVRNRHHRCRGSRCA